MKGKILLVIERTEAHRSNLVANRLGAAESRQIRKTGVEEAPATDEGAMGPCRLRGGRLAMMIATGRDGATRLVWARAGRPGWREGIAAVLHRKDQYMKCSSKRAEAHFAAAGRPGIERARACATHGANEESAR